jgi:hypothetical protein
MRDLDKWIKDNVNIHAIDSIKDIKELLILFSVSESFGNEPIKANEKHIRLTVKFPTKAIEIREISEGTESVKIMKLDWG